MQYPSSVVFLLSENYEQVFSKFNFPEPTIPNRRTANWRDAYSSSAQTPFRGLDEDFVNSVLNFDFFALPSCGPSTRCASVEPQDTILTEDTANLQFTAAETEVILRRVMTAPSLQALPSDERAEIHQQLQDLCRPARVSRFVACYFDIWHRNCRIVHRPSFGLDTCHEPLVLAVIFLGAMYSSNAMERIAMAALIEHVESFIFSCLPSSSAEVEHDREAQGVASDDEPKFQAVQAAFLMVIILFWTGTEVQKRRAATHLFDAVVEVIIFALAPWTQ
jgi:multisubunit Na+/H+ antiporter MnhF subunit